MRRVYYEGRPKTDELFWFQDNRTGCEKQTVYFERIRQLDSELLTKEQKHLVNAMERLKQLRYPRRKPVVLNGRNWEQSTKYQPQKSTRDKSLARQNTRHKQGTKSALVLNAKQMEICVEHHNDRPKLRPKTERQDRSKESLKNDEETQSIEQDTTKLGGHPVNNCSDNKLHLRKMPICDVFLPILPCIPNVGHKANIETENKLRILELANGEFQKCDLSATLSSNKDKKKTRCNSKLASGRQMKYASNQSDSLTPVLVDVFDGMLPEKELGKNSQDGSLKPQEIGKAETQTRDSKCEGEQDSSNVRQPPPPTRRNSQKSTSSFGISKESSNMIA